MATKYVCFVTPKAFVTIDVASKIPADLQDIEILPTHNVYMNMMSGWTSDECDGVAYIVEREHFERPLFSISEFVSK